MADQISKKGNNVSFTHLLYLKKYDKYSRIVEEIINDIEI